MPQILTINIKLKWAIKGYEDYKFGENKRLYNVKRGKELNPTVISGIRGYCLNSKFVSLKDLKPLLEKIKEPKCPF
jgi:hypothetical protein